MNKKAPTQTFPIFVVSTLDYAIRKRLIVKMKKYILFLLLSASAFIPVIGPFLSIGLGAIDASGGFDSVYDGF